MNILLPITHRAVAVVFILVPSFASAADQLQGTTQSPPAWDVNYSAETRVFSWHSGATPSAPVGQKGFEVYVPFGWQATGKPLDNLQVELVARGGWVHAKQTTIGRTGEISTVTDSALSGTVTYMGWNGVQPFAALSANVPTGQAALSRRAINARMDPDLVDITSFGEGWNVGPTVGFNFPISSNLLVTASAGYTYRGPFQREAAVSSFPENVPLPPDIDPALLIPTTLDPGDNYTLTAAVNFNIGQFSSNITGSLTTETETSSNGIKNFHPGNRYLLAGQTAYAWSETWGVTTLSASVAHSARNDVLLPTTSFLVKEILDSNSNVYRVGLQHMFPVGQFQMGPTGSVLYRDKNGYDSATLQFVPAKVRWSAGLLAQYNATQTMTFNARIEGVWTHESENPAFGGIKLDVLEHVLAGVNTVPAISATGLQVAFGLNYRL